jgi:hypothetical protein
MKRQGWAVVNKSNPNRKRRSRFARRSNALIWTLIYALAFGFAAFLIVHG